MTREPETSTPAPQLGKPDGNYGGGNGAAIDDVDDDAFERRGQLARHGIAEPDADYGGGNGAAIDDDHDVAI